jgi:hypothetical protein
LLPGCLQDPSPHTNHHELKPSWTKGNISRSLLPQTLQILVFPFFLGELKRHRMRETITKHCHHFYGQGLPLNWDCSMRLQPHW